MHVRAEDLCHHLRVYQGIVRFTRNAHDLTNKNKTRWQSEATYMRKNGPVLPTLSRVAARCFLKMVSMFQ